MFAGLFAGAVIGGCGAPAPVVAEVHVAERAAPAPTGTEESAPTATDEPTAPEPDASRPKRSKKGSPAPDVPEAATTATDVDHAKALFKLGTAAYANGDYANAKVQFEAAYAIVPENALLFNIASCELKMGQTSAACSHFRTYVAKGDPSDPRTQQVNQQLSQRCP